MIENKSISIADFDGFVDFDLSITEMIFRRAALQHAMMFEELSLRMTSNGQLPSLGWRIGSSSKFDGSKITLHLWPIQPTDEESPTAATQPAQAKPAA